MIRLANENDLKEILEIVKELIKIEDKKLINMWSETYPTKEIFKDDLQKNQLYVFDDDCVKAFVVISEEVESFGDAQFEIENNYVIVHRLCVNTKYHKNKIGFKLMKYVEKYATQNNKKAIRLDTYIDNPITNKFYKNLGYNFKGTMNRVQGVYNVYEKKLV